MSDSYSNSWEPQGLGKNWTAMFEQQSRDGKPPGGSFQTSPPQDDAPEEDTSALDLTDYKPWIIQRVRSRPALMLELRRYEPRSGLWQGWAMPYHGLYAVEYIGERMLSLDFGARPGTRAGKWRDHLFRNISRRHRAQAGRGGE